LREKLEEWPFIVVAPHPDDESLACGGLLAEACRQGLRGKVVVVSDGVGSHPNSKAYPPDRLRSLREEEARQAATELGLKPEDMFFLGLPDRFVPSEAKRPNERLARLSILSSKPALPISHLATRSPLRP
jgi:LmbE family N-acetylglucosaminyl deacetylase